MNNTNTINTAKTNEMTSAQLIAAGWVMRHSDYSFVFNATMEFWFNAITGQKLTRMIHTRMVQ